MNDNRMSADYQRNVSDFVRTNVVCCVSLLVSDVAKLVASADRGTLSQVSFEDDELVDLCQREDWETAGHAYINNETRHDVGRDELISLLSDNDVTDDRDEADILAAAKTQAAAEGNMNSPEVFLDEWPGISDDDLRAMLIAAIESDPNADDWETFGRHHDLDCEYDEVYEHWAVDPWFGARLKEYGEVVGDFGNLTVWGRCTTGQSISLDCVVCRIYDDLQSNRVAETQ